MKRALVVHGCEGLDELSIAGPSKVTWEAFFLFASSGLAGFLSEPAAPAQTIFLLLKIFMVSRVLPPRIYHPNTGNVHSLARELGIRSASSQVWELKEGGEISEYEVGAAAGSNESVGCWVAVPKHSSILKHPGCLPEILTLVWSSSWYNSGSKGLTKCELKLKFFFFVSWNDGKRRGSLVPTYLAWFVF